MSAHQIFHVLPYISQPSLKLNWSHSTSTGQSIVSRSDKYCFWAEAFKSPGTSLPLPSLSQPSYRHMFLMASLKGGGVYPVPPLTSCEGEIHFCEVKPSNFRVVTAA